MTTAYTDKLTAMLRSRGDAAQAEPMAAYMRHQFAFLGIRSPERIALTRAFLGEHGMPANEEELLTVAAELWSLPEREFHYTAMMLLEKRLKGAEPKRAELLQSMMTTHAWWDTVDLLAGKLAGSLFARYPSLIEVYIPQWSDSDNLWLNRSALLFQLHYKERTDEALLYSLIQRFAGHDDFFMRKAIGWALREYSKTNKDSVIRFVDTHNLSPLSEREALKWLRGKGEIHD